VTTRRATEADLDVLLELWQEFEQEVPQPAGFEPETAEQQRLAFTRDVATGAVYLAEDDQGPVGVAQASAAEHGRWHLELVYVRPRGRRQGIATALLRECVREAREHGAGHLSADVVATNDAARAVWRRLGFEEVEVLLVQPLAALETRLADSHVGSSHGTTHVQTDDRVSVERAVAQFVPRLEQPDVRDAAQGWIRIEDPLTDTDREAQERLAQELSERLGAVVVALAVEAAAVVRFRLYENGRMVDEYLSVPSFYGPLSKGDELALAANPTLVARLTGADRDEVRRVAQTASSPGELPPADELYRELATVMGLEP